MQNLPNIPNNPDFFGMIDRGLRGNYVDTETASVHQHIFLLNRPNGMYTALGGLHPHHVNREENGLLPRLVASPELNLSILEIFNISKSEVIRRYPFLKDFHLIPSSDAHDLDAITGILTLQLEEISVSALCQAFQTQY